MPGAPSGKQRSKQRLLLFFTLASRENGLMVWPCSLKWGRPGFDGDAEAKAAGRGAAGLVKSGNQVIAKEDNYAYAMAA